MKLNNFLIQLIRLMKKALLFIIMLAQLRAYAQPSVVEENKGKIKLSDAVMSYLQHEQPLQKEEEEEENEAVRAGKNIKEGNDYHFGRWLWYWKQHTDENGYMVSPLKTWEEWRKYQGAQAKTTGANLSNWVVSGPVTTTSGYRGIGRINAMAFHPTDPNTLWVGSAGGGVWKTGNNGASWACLTDMLPVLSVSDVDVNPKDPNTIYLCTGDRDSRDHFSIGVLKSVNGGTSWDTTGLKWDASLLRLANTLVINPVDTASLILAASDGIYTSHDGGMHWVNVKPGNFKQVLYHPTDTNIVYATSFYTVANNTPAQIFRSKDGGASWQQVTNLSQSWRITLAVCPGNVRFVKAVVATYDPNNYRGLKGIYSSGDTGKNFTLIHQPAGPVCDGNLLTNDVDAKTCGGQGNYDLAIAMNPANPNDVYVGGVNTWYSWDGGSNWTIVNQWTTFLPGIAEVHADKHFLGFHPLVAGRLFECNDGGIYWTVNPQSTLWNDITQGLCITQFYRNAVAGTANFVVGGAQDNGSRTYDYVNNAWDETTGGDGMDCQIDPVNPNIFYTGVQYGVIYKVDGFAQNISGNIPGQPTGAWITPYIISRVNSNHLLAGYQDIWFSDDQGGTWSSVTGGPLVAPNKNILRLAMTNADPGTIYAVPDSSNLVYYTHSFVPGSPASFTQLTAPYTGMISDIKVDEKDKDHFWITFGGFNSPQVAEYKSGNWTQINSNLPNVPVLCFEADSTNGILYVGTDVGVFYLDSVNKHWEPYSANMPAVHVTDLGINYVTGKIWAATYGRGMWSSRKQEYNNGISIIPYAADAYSIYPNPSKGQFSIVAKNSTFNGNVSLRLIDNTGKTTWKGKATFSSGKLNVDITGVAIGTYIFEVSGENHVLGRQKVTIY